MNNHITQTPRQVLGELREASLSNLVSTFLHIDMAGKSSATHRWYQQRLMALVEYLGYSRPLSEILESDLLLWHTWICSPERGLSRDSQRGHIRACKRLFAWAAYQGGVPDPAVRLKTGQPRRYARRGISESNFNRMVEAAQDNPRDLALLLFLAATGARRGGAANLRLADVDLDVRRCFVLEKGERERPVFLTDEAAEAMAAWLAVRPACESDHVFVGRSPGQAWHALSACGISEILKRYKNRLGLSGPCSPHQYRHRLGRSLAERGMTLGTISQIMGHQDPSVTVIHYGGFATAELQQAYNKTMNRGRD